jgi:hypothetical protein
MKKVMIIVLCLITIGCIGRADERPVKFERIPAAAQKFIKTNFVDNTVVHVTKDDDLVAPDYEVVLDNGTVVQFSNSGSLEKIEAYRAGVPQHLIPEKIREYVSVNYPGAVYREYEIDRAKHEVKLSNGLELTFNSLFNLIEIDD